MSYAGQETVELLCVVYEGNVVQLPKITVTRKLLCIFNQHPILFMAKNPQLISLKKT